jgi:DNA-binding NarL/FixJ family response regulator
MQPPTEPLSDPGALALIAPDDGPSELIGAILENRGLVFASFGDTQALLEDERAAELTTVLMWAHDTGPSLPRAIEPLRQRVEQARVIVLCAAIRGWEVHCALAAGALGIVLEDELEEALAACIDAVAAGQVCVPRNHWRQIEAPALSTREKQILGLVVMGYMNSQIAEQLFLAESTIKSHLSSAFAKLGVRSRHEAVSLIVDPERGLSMGILGLGGEPIELTSSTSQ